MAYRRTDEKLSSKVVVVFFSSEYNKHRQVAISYVNFSKGFLKGEICQFL